MADSITLTGTVDKIFRVKCRPRPLTKVKLVTGQGMFQGIPVKHHIFVVLPDGTAIVPGTRVEVQGALVSRPYWRNLADEVESLLIKMQLRQLVPSMRRTLGNQGRRRVNHMATEVLATSVRTLGHH